MLATGTPPAILSIHSFTPVWRGVPRPWKVGRALGLRTRACRIRCWRRSRARATSRPTKSATTNPMPARWRATRSIRSRPSRGLSNALIEIRQDLIATREDAEAWADRLARLVSPILAPLEARAPRHIGSRVHEGLNGVPPQARDA